MPFPSLTLFACGAQALPNHNDLIASLKSIGLTGEAVGEFEFLAGSHFFRYITFLGCAPKVPLSPDDDDNFLRIRIPLLAKPTLYANAKSPAPRCPHCNADIQQWQNLIEQATDLTIQCRQCNGRGEIERLNFRKHACYSRAVIQIEPIFESEALPGDTLLEKLKLMTGNTFKYAYI